MYVVVQLQWLYTAQTFLLVYIWALCGALSFSFNHITVIHIQKHKRGHNTHTHNHGARVIPPHYQSEGEPLEAEDIWIMWEQSRHLCGFTSLSLWLTGMSWPKAVSKAERKERGGRRWYLGSGWRRGTDGKKGSRMRRKKRWRNLIGCKSQLIFILELCIKTNLLTHLLSYMDIQQQFKH